MWPNTGSPSSQEFIPNPNALFQVRGDGHFAYLNQAARLWMKQLSPQQQSDWKQYLLPFLSQVLQSGQSLQSEYQWEAQTYLCHFVPHSDYLHVNIYLTDISHYRASREALAASESRFQTMIESLTQGLMIADLKEQIRYANKHILQLLGYSDDKALIGKSIREALFFDPQNAPLAQQMRHERGLGIVRQYEFEVQRPDGSPLWVYSRHSPLKNTDGKVIGVLIMVEDISDRKMLEEALEAARDGALAATRLKTQFIATMNHEIRTPMNGIIGMAELLLDTPLDEDQREFANIIVQESNKLLSVMSDILDYSKLEAGTMILSKTSFSPYQLMMAVVQNFQDLAKEKGLHLEYQLDPLIPDVLRGDEKRLKQCLSYILDNAIKFTAQGQVQVQMKYLDQLDGRVRLRFLVEDSGIGIMPEVQANLFQPFTLGDGSNTRRYSGTGLGLAILHRIVALMGGEIGVESEVGQGTKIWFSIWLGTQASGAVAINPIDLSNLEVPAPSPTPGLESRVLIVEDHLANQELLLYQLDFLGYPCELAWNGQLALDLVLQNPQAYPLILMDYYLPMLSGLEVTERIRQDKLQGQAQPIIIGMTADNEAESKMKGLDAGMDDYLFKPISMESLRAIMQRYWPKTEANP
jgi:PAS domain S-box-containing protein